jgi:undecaprenyl-diphosphatase
VDAERFRQFLARRFSREEAAGLTLTVGLLLSSSLVILFGLLARGVVSASPGPLDGELMLWARDLSLPGGASTVRLITSLGDAWFVYPATLLVVVVMVRAGRRVSAILFSAAVVGGGLLEVLLKLVFERARPDLFPPLARVTSYSFPSGHATLATAFYGGLAAVVFHVTRRRTARWFAVLAATLLAGGVCLSRVYLGVHWPTDVAAGALVGLFWVVVCATLTEVFARRAPRSGGEDRKSRAEG